MPRRLIECVPNFSEGRDRSILDQIAAVIGQTPDTVILNMTMDADHNRSVITFAGSPEMVVEAAIRAVGKAAELIDLNTHSGVHPRIGATDVLPFVPIEGITMQECVALAISVGEEIWRRFHIPVYLYEHAARTEERRRLENIRRGQFEELRLAVSQDSSRQPDIGGPQLHGTAGATVVGARQFLIAYNINLATPETAVARRIARKIRASSGGFPFVKALGLSLASRGQSQVSMNLTDFQRTPLHTVYEAVRREAELEGVEVAGSEIIGLIPQAALESAADYFLRCENYSPSVVLERRLREALPYSLRDLLDGIADPKQEMQPAEAAAISASLAAALGSRIARSMRSDATRFEEYGIRFQAASPPEIAEQAENLLNDLRALSQHCPMADRPAATTACGLADAALKGSLAATEFARQLK